MTAGVTCFQPATEVLEHWLSKQGCLKLKKATLAALARHCDDSDCCDSDASD